MAILIFDTALKNSFDSAMNRAGSGDTLNQGNVASPKGVGTIKSVLADAVDYLEEMSRSANPAVKAYSEVAMGTLGDVRFEGLVQSVTPGSGVTLTAPEIMIYAIDVERDLVAHFLKISQDKNQIGSKKRKEAQEIAFNLTVKLATDYRNLCVILNPVGATAIIPETVDGVNVMSDKPNGKNLYKVYNYVNTNFDTLSSTILGATMLSDADINGKTLPNDSIESPGVRASNFKERIFPDKSLGDEYKQIFGGLNRQDVTLIKAGVAAVGLAVLVSGTALIAKSCGQEEPTKETTKDEETLAPEDEVINNPADEFIIPEQEPGTNAEGEIVTEEDTHNYDRPATDRNPNKGSSDDFKSPLEQGGEELTLPAEEVQETEPEATERVTDVEDEHETVGNSAEDNEEPEHEGKGPSIGGSSSKEDEEDEGPLAGRF